MRCAGSGNGGSGLSHDTTLNRLLIAGGSTEGELLRFGSLDRAWPWDSDSANSCYGMLLLAALDCGGEARMGGDPGRNMY